MRRCEPNKVCQMDMNLHVCTYVHSATQVHVCSISPHSQISSFTTFYKWNASLVELMFIKVKCSHSESSLCDGYVRIYRWMLLMTHLTGLFAAWPTWLLHTTLYCTIVLCHSMLWEILSYYCIYVCVPQYFNCMHSTAGGMQTVEGGTTAGVGPTLDMHMLFPHTHSLYPKAMHYTYTVCV